MDNAEDLDLSVLEDLGIAKIRRFQYGKNYRKTTVSLWNYYRDEPNNSDLTINSESFKYKRSITGKTPDDGNTKEVEFSVPLKHLSNFWRTFNMSLINFEVNLILNGLKIV